MTLELSHIATQVKAMGQSLNGHHVARDEVKSRLQALLQEFSTAYEALHERVAQAEKVQQQERFAWVGAAPINEPLAQANPLPPMLDRVTVIASDGSQILPDPHSIALYYLLNVGSIIYRHGSGLKPETYNPTPVLRYQLEDLLDDQGRLISTAEVNVQRDLAELAVLVELAGPRAYQQADEPVVAVVDGQLPLRVIELPFKRQQECQKAYITMLDDLRDNGALISAYIDRPRSTFVVSLLHLASMEVAEINEATLRRNDFRYITDIDLFESLLAPGERSAIFSMRAKGLEKYSQAGHDVHFFFLNVGLTERAPNLARVEIPAWMVANSALINTLHSTLVRQARLAGSYPYVLARAHELAIISPEEREAVEMMLALELRRHGLLPLVSAKQANKNLLAPRESFRP